jgi:hypothetical protein
MTQQDTPCIANYPILPQTEGYITGTTASTTSRQEIEEEGGVMLGAHLNADREQELDSCQQELDEAELAVRQRITDFERSEQGQIQGQEGEEGEERGNGDEVVAVAVAVATDKFVQERDHHNGQHKMPFLLYFGCYLLALAAVGGAAAAVVLVNDRSSSSPSNVPTTLAPSQNEVTESLQPLILHVQQRRRSTTRQHQKIVWLSLMTLLWIDKMR